MSAGVAPDGSPVAIYLALPAGETPADVFSLDLGKKFDAVLAEVTSSTKPRSPVAKRCSPCAGDT
jgi:hypothetical protein